MEAGSADNPKTLLSAQGEGGPEVADGADLGVQWSAQTAVEFGESGGFLGVTLQTTLNVRKAKDIWSRIPSVCSCGNRSATRGWWTTLYQRQ